MVRCSISPRPVALSLALALSGMSPHAAAVEPGVVDACIASHKQAQEQRLVGNVLSARDSLRACAVETCPAIIARQCTSWLSEVDREIPSVLITVKVAGADSSTAKVLLDGRDLGASWVGLPVEVNPGEHRLDVTAQGQDKAVKFVATLGQQRRPVGVQLGRSPRREPTPERIEDSSSQTWGYALLGVGAAGLVTAAYLALSAISDRNELRDECAPSCDEERVDAARRKLLIADIVGGTATVALGVGGYLVLSAPAERAEKAWLVGVQGNF